MQRGRIGNTYFLGSATVELREVLAGHAPTGSVTGSNQAAQHGRAVTGLDPGGLIDGLQAALVVLVDRYFLG
jgi:hypothetical protein